MMVGAPVLTLGAPGPVEKGRIRLSLEPLRINGKNALVPSGIPELKDTRLTALKIICSNYVRRTLILEACDLFACSESDGMSEAIPTSGHLVEATFAFTFVDSPVPRSVIIRPPDELILAQSFDAEIVQRWASLHDFLAFLERPRGEDERAMAGL